MALSTCTQRTHSRMKRRKRISLSQWAEAASKTRGVASLSSYKIVSLAQKSLLTHDQGSEECKSQSWGMVMRHWGGWRSGTPGG